LIRSLIPSRRRSKIRQVSLRVDRLEAREVLSTSALSSLANSAAALQVAHPMFALTPDSTPDAGSGPNGGYTPSQITAAYGFSSISFNGKTATGAGETIAIVDAYNDPNISSDLGTFDSEFGLPTPTLRVVNETGGTSLPAADSTGGWDLEESLDVEWAHAIAPGATIILVEASSSSDSDLLTGVTTAATTLGANVVSMSWGGSEFSGESSYDSDFSHAGVVYTASSGDGGAPISWPAASPNVLAVGGTSLTTNGSTYVGETGWSGSGGGPSADESQPSYQSGVVTQTTKRANPDVAYDADPNTGFAVYDSVPYEGRTYDWLTVGGTSAGSPQLAALAALADQGRVAYGLPAINASSAQEIQTTLYKNTSDFHDITSGTSTGSPNYSAGPGYDYVTGIGSPIANLVVQSLDGTGTTQSPDHLVVTGATTDVAGSSYTLTVTAETSTGAVDKSYVGAVKLTSGDAKAVLPTTAYTFTSTDAGSHTFTATLKTAGTQSITATDTTTGATAATESGIVVSPAAASQFVLSGLTSNSGVGSADSFTITAEDPYGNTATGYTGTVSFTSTDAAASLPASHTFSTTNKGVYSTSITFNSAGTQTVTATSGSFSVTSSGVVVSPSGTITLTATSASSSQINLSWNAIKGATGYVVDRSANGSTGWTQVTSTASTVTTDSDTGLASGTTYYYRVQATGGYGSAFSNVASATTTGTVTTGGSLTLWPNSYTPSENYYSSGNYELGVKIRTDVTGEVTALRFYQQSWMAGYSHVGHLWSPSGTLLASATFANVGGSGWEQVTLSNPVSITANSVYIVSFSSGGGYFGYSSTYFASAGVNNGSLHALANGVSGGDGVYGRGGTFPTSSGDGDNFFADLVFSPTTTSGGGGGAAVVVGNAGGQSALIPNDGGTTVTVRDNSSASTSTTSPKVVVNTVGSWPGRRVASESQSSSTGRNRFGSFFGE
jgi:hypothetical protein